MIDITKDPIRIVSGETPRVGFGKIKIIKSEEPMFKNKRVQFFINKLREVRYERLGVIFNRSGILCKDFLGLQDNIVAYGDILDKNTKIYAETEDGTRSGYVTVLFEKEEQY